MRQYICFYKPQGETVKFARTGHEDSRLKKEQTKEFTSSQAKLDIQITWMLPG